MGGGQHPPGATVLLALAVGGIIAIVAAGNSNQGVSIQVKHDRRGVFLHCKVPDGSSVLSWSKDGSSVGSGTERNGRRLFVGSAADDPRGLYQCYSAAGNASLQLYFRHRHGCAPETKRRRRGSRADMPERPFPTQHLGCQTAVTISQVCQYCVQLDTATLLGIVAADVVATVFLVGAMWYLAAQEPGRLSRASDKQALLAHDQLYQPLGERNNGQYSHIGAAKARRR